MIYGIIGLVLGLVIGGGLVFWFIKDAVPNWRGW